METPPPHLEKMGRELKCPICLSLLSSAVSLNCNHLFCNACIVKSMKSGSNCPVCKIPYRRREVRPAPHMDNLVSIYKSMEDASGINIFVTQNAPSTKSSDGKQQAEDDFSHGEHDLPEFQDRAQKQKTTRGKGSRNAKANLKSSGSISIKPSFPNKKRVQVPQCPISETPTRHQKLEGDLMADRAKQSSKTLKEKPVLNEKGEPVLSPFFWLNDKDVESLSQFSVGDQLTDLPSPNVPAFSDIKDSDDENSVRLTQPGEVHGTSSHAADLFDSEIFEWTQIPCSPELFPRTEMQVGEDDNDRVQLKELKEVSQNKKSVELSAKSARSKRNKKSTGNMDFLPDLPAAGTKAVTNESDKRGRKAKNLTKRKCATSHTDPGTDINVTLKGSEVFYEGQACENYGSSLAKTRKRSKKEHSSVVVTKPTSENVHVLSTRADSRINGEENGITASPTSLGKNAGGDEPSSKKAGKMCREVNDKNKIDRPVRSKKQKMVSMQKTMLEASEIQKQANKDTPTELSLINLPTDDNQKASESWNNSRKLARKAKLGDQELKRNKKVKVSSDDNSKDDTSVGIGEGHGHVNENGNQPAEKSKGNCNVTTNQSPVQKLPSLTKNVVLKRCEAIPSKIQCAFCLSSEESEASGEIGHYYNGKPVAADHNGGLKVIHAHRICAEWAPNVYFEEDIAINLEAELTRSRKIKCSCCAIKGAALGCYEKSCRRSFHVTCAKLMPQCRWDTDNFVMLCPLHASSKLPNESPESQATRKKSNPKKQPNVECPKVAAKQHSNTPPDQKFCGPSKKLVLCCSSLTNAERESVSGFERLSGLTVLKNWDSNVTHVIASTDENGACRRTLKVLMGILEGKWILNVDYLYLIYVRICLSVCAGINACTEAMKLVDEEPYEINIDIYGIRDGPRLGRLRPQNKQPKLFDGFKFYFMGDFKPSYKGYLQDLVIAAGGTILQRKPVPEGPKALSAGSPKCQTYIIYSLELPDQCHRSKKSTIFNTRQADAKALASSAGAMAVSNSWVLNSIAACKLQNLSDFE
ncbi:protein BREAST CANCER SUSCEPTIBILITY 1 homolog [Pyrus communis]|uniref:protein BREAST CANCER SUSCEPTIBILITY 1 homolog n=1 Tax=Pyrus communis TaxID=23211 RepID=UPI0035BFF4E7